MGLSGLATLGKVSQVRAAASQPNFLFIIQDQLRYPAWFLDTNILPGLNRLRQEGVWFTNHFTCAAPCSPSRATILTGLHVPQHGLFSNIRYDVDRGGLSTTPRTLGHRFQGAGYRTPYFGKWHLSSASMLVSRGNNLSAYGYEQWTTPDYAKDFPDGLHDDPVIADQAVDWLVKHGSEGPWHLTVSLVNPHDIMYCPRECVNRSLLPQIVTQLPPNFDDSLATKPRAQRLFRQTRANTYGLGHKSTDQEWLEYMNSYCYFAQAADQQVSILLETLDNLGLTSNTLVVLTSDHGEMGGSHQLSDKGPMVYQEAIKVPLVLRWPSRLQPGQEISALTHSVDIVPTLADLGGLGLPRNLPGQSLKPLLTFTQPQSGNGTAAQLPERPSASRVHSYVLTAYDAALPAGEGNDNAARRIRAIFDGRYKYALYFDSGVSDEHELYDLENDPYELDNLADHTAHAQAQSHMSKMLSQARRQEMGENI